MSTRIHASRTLSTRRPRRGVVLLVVLTLLSLFIVISTTFLLIASQYMRAAQSQGKQELYGDPPQKLLDAAIYQVIRGTKDPNSNLGAVDLLSDLYGLDGFIAYAAVKSVSGNVITLHVPVPEINPNASYPYNSPTSKSVGDYVFWRKQTNRQAAYFPQTLPTSPPPPPALHQAPWMEGYYVGQQLTFIDVLPNPDQPAVMPPHSLKRNTVPIVSYSRLNSPAPPVAPFPFNDMPLNSQNVYEFVELEVTWPNNGYGTPSLSAIFGNSNNAVVTILVNGRPYNGLAGNAAHPDESYDAPDGENLFLADATDLTKPSYRGLGPVLANAGGTVSVDTDGDGVNDSRWLDIGLPLQTGRNGRQIKPLVGIRCVDLDGRINLNFSGSGAHLTTPNTWTIVEGTGGSRYRQSRGNASTDPVYANPYQISSYGQGSGIGPGDITLFDVLAKATKDAFPAAANSAIEAAARTWYSQLLTARYGAGAAPGVVGDDATVANSPAELKFRPYKASSSYLDFHSALRFGMDPRGMPTMEPPYHAGPLIDSPYDLRADAHRGTTPGATDHLFSLSELERLLRYYDWDANSIPSRLRTAYYDIDGDSVPDPLDIGDMASFRNSVTTESWDLGLLKLRDTLPNGDPVSSFVTLVEPFLPTNSSQHAAIMKQLVTSKTLAPELVYGMPLDLNRQLAQLNLSNPVDYADRQMLARQLYVLMLIVGDVQSPMNYPQIAQWAINVVDYRDQDSVMTPFEYDTNPFNGWGVDGDPFGNPMNDSQPGEAAVVWGCERPELLISEAFAFHDVRVQRVGMNFQQPYRPRGSVFVELYNPWASPFFGSDLNPWGTNFNNGVMLTATAPSPSPMSLGAPVWRLNFRRQADGDVRLVYFTNPLGSGAPTPAQRTYFSNVTANPLYIMPGHYGVVGSVGWPVDPAANGFNSDIDGDGNQDFVNALGFPVGTTIPPLPTYTNFRRIQMSRGPNGQTFLTRVDGSTVLPKPAVACVVNQFVDAMNNAQWRSFNISEPLGGYPVQPIAEPIEQKYVVPGLTPFDEGDHINNGNVENRDDQYSSVKLERLANPYIPFHPTLNPYFPVDESANVTLTRFNGISTDPSSPDPVVARERHSSLWSSQNAQLSTRNVGAVAGSHYYNDTLRTTLGYLNSTSGLPELTPLPAPATPTGLPQDYYVGSPATGPFPWLTWLNRPFRNQFELNDVPKTTSEDLLKQYESPSTYTGAQSHLLPLMDYRASGGQNTTNPFYQILHYTQARSPFLGTEAYVGADVIPRRVPGRVNINTIPNETAWVSLWNGIEVPTAGNTYANSWIPLFSEIDTLRDSTPFQTPNLSASLDQDPLLWAFANNNLQRGLRRFPRGGPPDNMPHMNGDLHTYYRFHGLNRIGSSITTTSNVFAVWVTVGYFEMSMGGTLSGLEYNAETGEQVRHRAFYIIDRSIPVAFEPGESHNVDRTILLRRMIE